MPAIETAGRMGSQQLSKFSAKTTNPSLGMTSHFARIGVDLYSSASVTKIIPASPPTSPIKPRDNMTIPPTER